jgi:hypothetical protein
VLSILERYVDITNTEISKNDERIEQEICMRRGIPYRAIYLPRIMKSVYDVDPGRLKAMYEAGREAAEKVG